MSNNVFSNEQYLEMKNALDEASDKLICIEKFARKYTEKYGKEVTTRSLRAGLFQKYPKDYPGWFLGSELKSKLSKKEMVTYLMDMTDTPSAEREIILSSIDSMSFSAPFTYRLTKYMILSYIEKFDVAFAIQREKLHNWKLPNSVYFWTLSGISLLIAQTLLLIDFLDIESANFLPLYIVVFITILMNIQLDLRREYDKTKSLLQEMKEIEEEVIHEYKILLDYFPDQILADIDKERWLEAREELKRAFNSINQERNKFSRIEKFFYGKPIRQSFIGFDEIPQRPHVFGLYKHLSAEENGKCLIWNRRGISAMCFKYIDKKIVKHGEWLDKKVYKKNEVDKLFQK